MFLVWHPDQLCHLEVLELAPLKEDLFKEALRMSGKLHCHKPMGRGLSFPHQGIWIVTEKKYLWSMQVLLQQLSTPSLLIDSLNCSDRSILPTVEG